jgi:feruloyl esterase
MSTRAISARLGRILVLASLALLLLQSETRAVAQPDTTKCASLAALDLRDVHNLAAEWRPGGTFSSAEPPVKNVPPFCRVSGIVAPTPTSEIHFEVWLPSPGSWNGKFEGIGNHAFQGGIAYEDMADGLRRGYATAATDTGHTGDDLKFGTGDVEKRIDWAFRSVHLTTQLGKLVVREFESRFPDHSYFSGCDSGGQEGLTEATRYPHDYDGIVAGNPAADRLHEVIGYLGIWNGVHDAKGNPVLTPAALSLLTKSAIAACDALDGVSDGVIENPAACRFDPSILACKAEPSDSCLTPDQIAAAKLVHDGIRNPHTHQLIFPGYPVGSEAYAETPAAGWGSMVSGREPRRVQLLQNFVFDNPNWDWHTFDFDRDVTFADQRVGYIAATSNDLSSFSKHGGKLLMYMGWADPILPAEDVTQLYEGKVEAAGSHNADTFMRLYMVPGMGHCGGGPGTTTFDMLNVLEAWVEAGKAPSSIIASRPLPDNKQRTRPLCPYPQVAHWKGSGSTDDAANFACIAPNSPTSNATHSAKPTKGRAR